MDHGISRPAAEARSRSPIPDDGARDYKVGYKKPPLHSRFKKGQSGNPRGRPRGAKNFSSVLNDALNQPVFVTENGRRRKISKRELGIRRAAAVSCSRPCSRVRPKSEIATVPLPRVCGCCEP